jgi:hypothetical protein
MQERTTRRHFVTASAVGIVGGLAGCTGGGGDDSGSSDENQMDDGSTDSEGGENMNMDGPATVAYEVSNLPELSQGTYEGWAIFEDEKLSTGTFSPGDELTFETERSLGQAKKIVVTIEPENDPSEAPSGVKVLAGAIEEGTASLSFPVDLSSAAGSYILNTPTSESGETPESGLWFLEPPGDGGPSASLSLPELPAGWVYEGWAVSGGQPLSTGRFSDPAAADDFDGFSGDAGAPPFPGEDFLQNAPDGVEFPLTLNDGSSKAVISVEPDIDGMDPTGEKPFSIKPLRATIPGDAEIGTSYDMKRKIGNLPSGTATLK